MIRLFQAWCFGVRDSWFHWGCVKAFPKRWRLAQLGIYKKSFAGAERSHWLNTICWIDQNIILRLTQVKSNGRLIAQSTLWWFILQILILLR